MPDFYPLARKLLWLLPPETAHKAALLALRAHLGFFATDQQSRGSDDPVLAQSLWGLTFPNPIGVAAGFDKDASVPDRILECGFAAVEVGTVTPKRQRGNDGERVFRLDNDDSIINRMGFPSAGLDVVSERLAKRQKRQGILGINLGKNRDSADAATDYVAGVRRMAPFADYLVINISSPNTPGLRDLQRREPMEELIAQVIRARDAAAVRPPLLVKIAPDLSADERADIAAVSLMTGIDGIIVANTTTSRPSGEERFNKQGGLSGPPLFQRSTELLSQIYELTSGRIPLIGVGGISTAEEAYTKVRAGASLVQMHTALIFGGMNLVGHIKRGLVRLLAADGLGNIAEAVGADHRDGGRLVKLQPARVHAYSHSHDYLSSLAPAPAGN